MSSRATAHDRWIVPYADFMTLLFAFFCVAYTSPGLPAASPAPAPAPPPAATAETIDHLHDQLATELADALRASRVEISEDARGLVLSLPDEATFLTGSASVQGDAADLICRIASLVQPLGLSLRVEGHTDNVPVRGSAYKSNWELSTARASAVVAMLIARAGFEPAHLAAAGYGEFQPRASNDSPEDRARNRRVDLVVVR
jgi:chemotaxis protein MotB